MNNIYLPAKRIYLAGGASENEQTCNWRDTAVTLLPSCECLNPFRGKDMGQRNDYYTANEIVTRDLVDIQSADLVLAEMMRADYNYIGTSMEIRTAADLGIPVVMWCPERVASHYWIQYHTVKSFPTLNECCSYIESYWCI